MTCEAYISTLDTDTPFTVGLLPRFGPISGRSFQRGLGSAHTAAAAALLYCSAIGNLLLYIYNIDWFSVPSLGITFW